MENSPEVKVESVKAINETSVEVTFPSDSAYKESGLKGKEITLTGGNEQTLTATYKDGSLLDGKAVFLLSGDNKLVADATYTVSAEWATFETTEFTFVDQTVVEKEQADAVTDLINAIPEDEWNKNLLENGAEVLAAKTAFDKLSDAAKALVSKEDKDLLNSKVGAFTTLTKGEVSGVVTAITKVDTLQEKQTIVANAQAHLNTAKELGMDEAEYNFYTAIVKEAIKTIEGEQSEVDAAVNAANLALEALPAADDVNAENLEAVTAQVEEAKELIAKAEKLDNKVTFDKYPIEQLDAKIAELVKANQDTIDAAVNKAQAALDALVAPETVTQANKAEVIQSIANARALVEAANALDENVVFNMYPVEQLEVKISELNGEVDTVVEAAQAALDALPAEVTAETLADAKVQVADVKEKIEAAQAVDANVVFNTYPLEQLEAAIVAFEENLTAQEAAVEAAELAISQIGNPADFTLATLDVDAAKVQNATDKIKVATDLGAKTSAIVNYDHYEYAKEEIATLTGQLTAKKQAILAAKVAMTNLPIAKNISMFDDKQVKDARLAYDAAIAKGAVAADFDNVWKLTAAEFEISKINTTAAAVKDVVELDYVLAKHATEVTLDASFTATENVTIESNDLTKLELNGSIDGNLTVNAPKADVINNATVSGTIHIGAPDAPQTFARNLAATNGGVASWTEKATMNRISVNAPVTLNVEGDVAELTLNKATTLIVADTVTLTATVVVKADSEIVSKTPVQAKVSEGTKVTVKENADDETGVEIVGTDSDNPVDVVALATAIDATTSLEALVDTVAKAEELVTDKEKRQAVSNAFLKASNKIQSVTGDAKTELMNRADAANDIAIAASFVDSLQKVAKDLTADNLSDAKIKLTSTQGNVGSLPEGEVKNALNALVQVEADKINAATTVKSIAELADVEVEFGGEYTLPKTVQVTLSNDETVAVPVVWDDSRVNVEYPTTYTVKGTLDVSTVENLLATDLTATVDVVVGEDAQMDALLAATQATNAYVAAPYTTLDEVKAAESLEVAATEAISKVNNADFKAPLLAKVEKQKALVASAKAVLEATAAVETAELITFTSTESITAGDVKIGESVVGTVASSDADQTYVITFTDKAPTVAFDAVIGDVTYTITPSNSDDGTTWTAVKKDVTPQ